MEIRIGQGFDRHRLVPGVGFPLAGVEIEGEFAVEAHSDGDVVLHALIDALLGATGQGDIGDLFPPTDDRWRDVASHTMLDEVLGRVRPPWRIANVDVTVFLQRPKLARYKSRMRTALAKACDLSDDCVNIKAKTGERVGAVGRSESVDAAVVVLLTRPAA